MTKHNQDKFFSVERKCPAYSNEKNWIGEIGVCNGTKEREPCSCGGNEQKCDFYAYVRDRARKRPTNADRIRAMSDEELAEEITGRFCPSDEIRLRCKPWEIYEGMCKQCWLDWLKTSVSK